MLRKKKKEFVNVARQTLYKISITVDPQLDTSLHILHQ